MPRSFLVKKASSHKIPNYGHLETRRGVPDDSAVSSVPILPPVCQNEAEPSVCCGNPWDRSSVITRITLDADNKEGFSNSTRAIDISLNDSLHHRALVTPLKDTLNNLHFPPSPNTKKRPKIEQCKEVSNRLPGVQNTSASEVPARFDCFDCHRSYHTFSGLAKHRQLHCELSSRKNFSCKYCEKEYVSLGALKMHIRTHTLPCVCRICSKAFSRPWLLQGHIRTHTGEKPFTCPHCTRAFADRSNLRAHLQTHTDIKKYQCPGCSKTFSRVSLLCKHQDTGCGLVPPQPSLAVPQSSKGLTPGEMAQRWGDHYQ